MADILFVGLLIIVKMYTAVSHCVLLFYLQYNNMLASQKDKSPTYKTASSLRGNKAALMKSPHFLSHRLD